MIFKQVTDFTLFRQRRQNLRGMVQEQFPTVEGVIVLSAAFESDRYRFRQVVKATLVVAAIQTR